MSALMYCMFALTFMTLASTNPCPAPDRQLCPNGWDGWEGNCYKTLKGVRKRVNATTQCHKLDGRLATPNSLAEYEFIWKIFTASRGISFNAGSAAVGHGVWTGCTDVLTEGVWVCDGSESSSLYLGAEWFYPTNPRGTPDELDCAAMSVHYPMWIAHKCDGWKYAVCERPAQKRQCCKDARCVIAAMGRCMHSHTYQTITIKMALQCCLLCKRDWRCRSFNIDGNQCQLNNATRYDINETYHLLVSPDCAHYDIAVL